MREICDLSHRRKMDRSAFGKGVLLEREKYNGNTCPSGCSLLDVFRSQFLKNAQVRGQRQQRCLKMKRLNARLGRKRRRAGDIVLLWAILNHYGTPTGIMDGGEISCRQRFSEKS